MCRGRAETEPSYHDYWIDRAINWLEQAKAPSAPSDNEAAPKIGD
jgi:hypothetical protein